MFDKKHPELEKNEIFLMNLKNKNAFDILAYKTKRIGKIAYTENGKPIENTGIFPVFVNEEEYLEKMSQRLTDQTTR